MKSCAGIAWTLGLALQVASWGASAAPESLFLEGHPFPASWHIQFFDAKKADLGSLDVHFTAAAGHSCLGTKSGKSFLVVVDRKTRLSPLINVTDSPALSFDGSNFVIDLTGGICDAYVLMTGAVPFYGEASGEVSTMGWGASRTIATFVATPVQ